jgi:hypothetical protein
LPVKDTDQSPVYDVVSAPRKFFTVCNQFNGPEFLRSGQLLINKFCAFYGTCRFSTIFT